ncbi:MAG TPA: phage holin family protein [Patescibacteria group bacterium]|nr:phage holin family protein [Patescibacteria group bacterium]
MKYLLRSTFIYSFALYVLPNIISGIKVTGGLATYLYSGIILTLMMILFKPVLSVISIPLNLLTLGLFSTVSNAIMLYVLTVFVPEIVIQSFATPKVLFAGFIIPSFSFGSVFAYMAVAFFLFLFISLLQWVLE